MANYKAFSPTSWKAFMNRCASLFPFLKKTFIGTRAEWDALTLKEKQNYDKADITDDLAGGELIVSDAVTAGDLNPVTSNAVAHRINDIKDIVANSADFAEFKTNMASL